MWRIRCKTTWFKLGDAPNQYFLKLLQEKIIRETIKVLSILGGGVIEDEEEILRLVFLHCRNLYSKDFQVDCHLPL